MKIVKQELAPSQYFPEVVPKRNIVLHHTVSSTAQSALAWWAHDPRRVATAFVVEKDGTVFQAFDPKYWAHHLGLKSPDNTRLNQQSIGIELVNEGPLQWAAGAYRWNFGAKAVGLPYRGKGCHQHLWRGFAFWSDYTEAQYAALNELVPMLCGRFGLPLTQFGSLELNMAAPERATVYAHCNLRRDKTDISPAFDFGRLAALQSPALAA